MTESSQVFARDLDQDLSATRYAQGIADKCELAQMPVPEEVQLVLDGTHAAAFARLQDPTVNPYVQEVLRAKLEGGSK